MSKEIEKTTEENSCATRKLVKRWILTPFLILVVFGFLVNFLFFTLGLPQEKLIVSPISSFGLLYMVFWTTRFFLKRKYFIKKGDMGSLGKIVLTWISYLILIILLVIVAMAYIYFGSLSLHGLSITGTMFWNGEPAETVSVMLCPSGTAPGISYPLSGIEEGCDEKSAPYAITDASGEYRFFNIPSGKYWIFYKWLDEDDWNLGETTKESTLIFVKEGSVTKVDPIAAFKEDWFIEPKRILYSPSVISTGNQEVIFKWNPLKDAGHYYIGIFDESGIEHPGETIFSDTVINPVIKVLLPEGKFSLGIRAYNLEKELIGKEWYFFEVKE